MGTGNVSNPEARAAISFLFQVSTQIFLVSVDWSGPPFVRKITALARNISMSWMIWLRCSDRDWSVLSTCGLCGDLE
jgi:hypothetical protein